MRVYYFNYVLMLVGSFRFLEIALQVIYEYHRFVARWQSLVGEN